MKKINIKYLVIGLVLVLGLGYLAYDSYFQLPMDKPAPSVGEGKGDAENKEEEIPFDTFKVLVLGLDGRAGVNNRADTIMLVSLDAKKKEAQILSIPRDTRVKIKGAWDKVNAAYAYGGLELTKETISDFLEVDIDRYAIIDFNGVVKVVDEVGGLEVDVPLRMYVPLEGIDLQPGKQQLNGKEVLAYSRFRGTSEGDIGRAKRQQEVLKLLAEKVLSGENLSRVPQIINVVKDNMETDMTIKEMVSIARLAPAVMDNGITAKVLPGENKKIDGLWFWEPDTKNLAEFIKMPGGQALVAGHPGEVQGKG